MFLSVDEIRILAVQSINMCELALAAHLIANKNTKALSLTDIHEPAISSNTKTLLFLV